MQHQNPGYSGPDQPPQQYGMPQPGVQQQQPGYPAPGQYGGQQQMNMMPQQTQPGQAAPWMTKPSVSNCPPGLEYLTQIDQILVHQQVELLEAFTGFETQNKYAIKNVMGQQVYFAAEESDVCMRQCCGPQRGFTMHVTDNMGQEVIRVMRPFKCCAGTTCCACSDCCAQECEVQSPVGQPCGYIRQAWSCLAPKFEILDADRKTIFTLTGPICFCQGPCCMWDIEFILAALDGTQIGRLSKQWSGLVKEYFTKADNFGINFPMDLDVKMKATLLGCVFLIDFMFFENQEQSKNN